MMRLRLASARGWRARLVGLLGRRRPPGLRSGLNADSIVSATFVVELTFRLLAIRFHGRCPEIRLHGRRALLSARH